MAARIRKNDTVIVLAGKDKGRSGKVLMVMPKDERVVATTTSAASTISIPPAVARPSTATTIGFSRSRYTKPPNPPRSVSSVAAVPVSRITLRSAPAQNTGRAWPSTFALRTPTRRSGSSSIRSTAASSATARSRSTALRALGRLSVMTPTAPFRS